MDKNVNETSFTFGQWMRRINAISIQRNDCCVRSAQINERKIRWNLFSVVKLYRFPAEVNARKKERKKTNNNLWKLLISLCTKVYLFVGCRKYTNKLFNFVRTLFFFFQQHWFFVSTIKLKFDFCFGNYSMEQNGDFYAQFNWSGFEWTSSEKKKKRKKKKRISFEFGVKYRLILTL